jgi:NDP-sugar pyrophosphorylase family protein
MKAVVLAGGKGSRLQPYTKILPKPLMPIGDMPILEILLHQLRQAHVDEVHLAVGHLAGLLRAFFENGERFGLKIHYSYEERPLGTAGPLSLVSSLNEPFLVMNGDVLTTLNLASLLKAHCQSNAIATIAVHQRQVRLDLGVLELNGSNEILNYLEKPTYYYTVSMGIYVFDPRVLLYIPSNHHLDLPDLILNMIKHGERLNAYLYDGYWQDLGNPDDYEQAIRDFDKLKPQILGEA